MFFTWITSSIRLGILVLGFLFLMMPDLLAEEFTEYYFYDNLEGKEIWYYAGSTEKNYTQAREICHQIPGARLVVPTSAQQREFLYTGGVLVTTSTSKYMFTGITDEDVEDTWIDEDGMQITYTAWNTGEPDGDPEQNCVGIKKNNDDGSVCNCWHDVYCYRDRTFACQTEIWMNGATFADTTVRSDLYRCSSIACLTSGQFMMSGSKSACASACTSKQRCRAFRYNPVDGSCLLSGDESSIYETMADVGNMKCCFRVK